MHLFLFLFIKIKLLCFRLWWGHIASCFFFICFYLLLLLRPAQNRQQMKTLCFYTLKSFLIFEPFLCFIKVIASKRTSPEDASTFFAVWGKKSILLLYGKLAILAYEKRSLKPNFLFLAIPGKNMSKLYSLFQMGKRSIKPNSIIKTEGKEPEHLEQQDDYKDESEEDEINEVKRGRAEYWARRQGDSNFRAARSYHLWDRYLIGLFI